MENKFVKSVKKKNMYNNKKILAVITARAGSKRLAK